MCLFPPSPPSYAAPSTVLVSEGAGGEGGGREVRGGWRGERERERERERGGDGMDRGRRNGGGGGGRGGKGKRGRKEGIEDIKI